MWLGAALGKLGRSPGRPDAKGQPVEPTGAGAVRIPEGCSSVALMDEKGEQQLVERVVRKANAGTCMCRLRAA